ncbi:hypothetical protein GW17_00027348, partial [Ensete ventricosum]
PARAKRPPADSERSDDVSRIRRLYLSSRGEVRAPHGWTRRRTSVRRRLGYCLNLGAKRLCSFHHEGRGQQVVLLSTDTSEASSTHYVVVHRLLVCGPLGTKRYISVRQVAGTWIARYRQKSGD